MRPMLMILLGLLWAPCGLADPVTAETFTGAVMSVEGGAFIEHQGVTVTASKNMEVRQGDTVRTDHRVATGLAFSDDTIISMGPNTEITIDNYLFEPIAMKLSFIAALNRRVGGVVR